MLLPFQLGVIKEKKELDNKIGELNTFLQTVACSVVTVAEGGLLHRQLDAMRAYSDTLNERIELFNLENLSEA